MNEMIAWLESPIGKMYYDYSLWIKKERQLLLRTKCHSAMAMEILKKEEGLKTIGDYLTKDGFRMAKTGMKALFDIALHVLGIAAMVGGAGYTVFK